MREFEDRLFATEVSLGGQVYTLRELFEVMAEDLSNEYGGQAPRLAWLGVLEAQAEASYMAVKNRREREYADAQKHYRTPGNMPAEIKPTDKAVEALSKLDEDYIEAQADEANRLKQLKTIRALVYAMRQRGEMLISMGATQRAEYDSTGMHINRLKRSVRGVTGDGE
jgi:hypothetical protein